MTWWIWLILGIVVGVIITAVVIFFILNYVLWRGIAAVSAPFLGYDVSAKPVRCHVCKSKKKKRLFIFGERHCRSKECPQNPKNKEMRAAALDEMVRLNQEMGLYDDNRNPLNKNNG